MSSIPPIFNSVDSLDRVRFHGIQLALVGLVGLVASDVLLRNCERLSSPHLFPLGLVCNPVNTFFLQRAQEASLSVIVTSVVVVVSCQELKNSLVKSSVVEPVTIQRNVENYIERVISKIIVCVFDYFLQIAELFLKFSFACIYYSFQVTVVIPIEFAMTAGFLIYLGFIS